MSKNKAPPTKKIESESEESSEEVKPTTTKTPPATTKAPTKTAPTPVKKTEESGSSSEESDEVAKPSTTKTPVAPPAQKKAAKVPPTTTAKKEESSEDSESEEVKAKPVNTKTPVKTTAPVTTPAKKVESEEESSEEEVKPAKGVAKPATTTAPVAKKGKDESSGSEEESSEEIKRITSDDNPKGLKRKRDEVDTSTNKKRKLENGGSTNGGGASVKVRLGNLSFELDGQVDEIKNQFSACGEILNVEMIARHDGRWAGVAILEFGSQDGANKALEMHDQDFWGRKMNLSYPKESSRGGGGGGGFMKKEISEKPEGCNTVFIANLSYQITEEEVKEFFSQCGDVRDVRWPKGEFKGFGWVEFSDTNAPDKAIELAGSDLMGRAVRVDYAAPKKSNW